MLRAKCFYVEEAKPSEKRLLNLIRQMTRHTYRVISINGKNEVFCLGRQIKKCVNNRNSRLPPHMIFST